MVLDGFSWRHPCYRSGCVITDVRMPEVNGLELLRQLKNHGIDWPVIVIAGQADVRVAIEAIIIGRGFY